MPDAIRTLLELSALAFSWWLMWRLGRMYRDSEVQVHAKTQDMCDRCFKAGMRYQAQIHAERKARRIEDLARLIYSHDAWVAQLRESRNAFTRGREN